MNEVDHFVAGALALMSLSLLFHKTPDVPDLRRSFYISGAVTGIGTAGIVLFLWHFGGHRLAEFGLFGWWGDTAATVAAAAAWVAVLVAALTLIKRGLFREKLHGVYRRYEKLMPRTRRELFGSWATSIAAGSGEEIVFRGFLLWYGAMWAGVPASLVATSLLFGFAHGYQSRIGVVFATIAGLIVGGIYIASGSLLLAMWVHSTYNMASFAAGRMLLRRESTSG